MKTGLYIYFILLVFFLQCDLKAECNYKNSEYNWVIHPLHFYKNMVIDSTLHDPTTMHVINYELNAYYIFDRAYNSFKELIGFTLQLLSL